MKACLAVICIAIIIISTCGCLWDEEKEEEYILEGVISVDKNVVWIVYPDKESETIIFNASLSKGDIVSYYWNFTGGNNWDKEGVEVTYKYSEPGYYIVKLKVVDSKEAHDYNTVDVYVNYRVEYDDNITKAEGGKSYSFPLKLSVQSAVVTLQYEPYDPYPLLPGNNVNNLDLYVYYNESDESEVANSTTSLYTKASDTIEEIIELSRNDLLHNLTGMRVSVKWAKDCLSETSIDYNLVIDVHYEPGYV